MKADATALPKHVQTSEALIRDISAGRLRDGQKLPPEREMAADLGIAVGTLRKALGELQAKGLLERIHGSGNYVRRRPEAAGLYAFFRLERLEGGGLPTADLITVEKVTKPGELPEFGRSNEAFRIRRVRQLSNIPVALEEIWLDGHWADEIEPKRLSESLYLFYRRALGLWITRAEDRVGLDQAPEWGHQFGVFDSDTVGYVERLSEIETGEVVEYSRTWFNTNRARFVARMK